MMLVVQSQLASKQDRHTIHEHQSTERTISAPDIEISLTALEHIGTRARSLLNALRSLHDTDVDSFSRQLRTSFASAPTPPSTEMVWAIKQQSLLNIEETLYRQLQAATPPLGAIQGHLEQLLAQEHLLFQVTKRAIHSIRNLPDEQAPLPVAEKLVQYEQCITKTLGLVARAAQLKEFVATQAQNLEYKAHAVPRDSELWRQALLASELYECSRNGSLQALHAQFDLPGAHNQLFRQLPPVYEINLPQLVTALSELIRDPKLAVTIAGQFISSAETYQDSRVTIQAKLGLSSSEMQVIEQRLPLSDLSQVLDAFCDIDIVSTLMRRALVENRPGLCTAEELHSWAGELHRYCLGLSSYERLVPGLSPWQSPDVFLSPENCTLMIHRLPSIREDQQAELALYRLAAFSRMSSTLKLASIPYPDKMLHYLSLVLSYGFGIPSSVDQRANTIFELTINAYRTFSEDIARVAPNVSIPSVRVAEREMRLILECCLRDGVVKHPPSPKGPIETFFELSPAVRGIPLWKSVTSLVDTLRTGHCIPERLLTPLSEAPKTKKTRPANAALQTTTGALDEEHFRTFTKNLSKALQVFEAALSELPTLQREHLIKKQLNVLTSAFARIRDVANQLQSGSAPTSSYARMATHTTLLKPPNSTSNSELMDFIHIAKTSLHLLKKALTSTIANQEGL